MAHRPPLFDEKRFIFGWLSRWMAPASFSRCGASYLPPRIGLGGMAS